MKFRRHFDRLAEPVGGPDDGHPLDPDLLEQPLQPWVRLASTFAHPTDIIARRNSSHAQATGSASASTTSWS